MQRTLSLIVVLLAAGFAGLVVRADDKPAPKAEPPKAGSKPAPIEPAEVKQAEELLKPVKNDEFAVLCGLRYLLSPSFEEELFTGRWRPVCPIDSFEALGDAPLSQTEQLRLWAVLETGMARNDAMNAQFARLIKTPPPELQQELAPAGVFMLTLRAALSRLTMAEAAKLIENARLTVAAAKRVSNACTAQSKWVTNEGVAPQWFANHFWRAVINRCALDLGLAVDFKLWGRDLDFLHRAHVDGKGWTCKRDQQPDISEDVHANLLAMAAFGLASGAPPAQFSKGDLRAMEQAQKRAAAVLARIPRDYADFTFVGGRALMLQAALAAPEGEKDPAGWRNECITLTQTQLGTGSAPALSTDLPAALGLNEDAAMGDVAEAALGLVCACGGLFKSVAGPLEKRDLSQLGRLLHALATIEASKAPLTPPPGPTDLDKRVEIALESCRQHLLKLQNPDGSFSSLTKLNKHPGTGPDCLALWALMHCGESRNSKAVQRCMKFLESQQFGVNFGTYEIGLQLCMLEKYFEPEIVASGMYLPENFEDREIARKKLREAIPARFNNFVDNSWKRLDEAWDGNAYGYGSGGFNWSDNSNSQFAMLGMRAAVALGAEVKVEVFVREAKRLFNTFSPINAFDMVPLERPWKPKDQYQSDSRTLIRPGGWGYSGGLASDGKFKAVPHGCSGGGLCSLAIAIDELAFRKMLKPEDELAADKCLAGGIAALMHCGVRLYGLANERIKIEDDRAPKAKKEKKPAPKRNADDWEGMIVDMLVERTNNACGSGRGLFYDLWAMERGFVICGVKTFGGVDWYQHIATYLLSCQMPDGSWRPKNLVGNYTGNNVYIGTAWAALILKRVAPPVWAPQRRGPDAPPRPGKPVRPETSEPDPKPKEGPVTPGK
ncbi:MAG: hypothetical protein KBG84_11490 [Planctomycetes bacterium]|nr:hypothetical protein [Planctomycetota bacterium]